jgi:hypothetical protein
MASESSVSLGELGIVALVGFALAQGSKRVSSLNDNPILTRTLLYTLGYYIATRRPEGGYALLKKS